MSLKENHLASGMPRLVQVTLATCFCLIGAIVATGQLLKEGAHANRILIGYTLWTGRVSNIETCFSLCSYYPGCASLNWIGEKQACQLKAHLEEDATRLSIYRGSVYTPGPENPRVRLEKVGRDGMGWDWTE